MMAFALETGTPCNSFLIVQMSLQNRFYAVFFDGTSSLGTVIAFTLNALHTLSAFWIKLSLSSFPPVNSQSVLIKYCVFISDILFINEKHSTHISEADISFFMIPSRSLKFIPPSHHWGWQVLSWRTTLLVLNLLT